MPIYGAPYLIFLLLGSILERLPLPADNRFNLAGTSSYMSWNHMNTNYMADIWVGGCRLGGLGTPLVPLCWNVLTYMNTMDLRLEQKTYGWEVSLAA